MTHIFIKLLFIKDKLIYPFYTSILHWLSINPRLTYSGVPSDCLNLENKKSQYLNGECLKMRHFYFGESLIP